MAAQRVVVTGIGWVTPVGCGREAVWTALLEGRCGTAAVSSFDTSAYPVHRGGEVDGFSGEDHVRRLDPAYLGRASQLGIAAARMALADAGLEEEDLPSHSTGVVMGTTSGEPREVERFDDRYLDGELDAVGAEFMDLYPCHVLAGHLAAELELAGPNLVIPAACAAGNYAVGHAFDLLRSGRAEVMLAGGADAFSRITYTGFARLGAIAPEVCQPFDRNRKGMIPGEGAAVLILEGEDRARRRGAHLYAEVAGYGLSCDAHHMTAAHPEGAGAARAMERALAMAGVAVEAVDYVSAHGTGTPTNDRLETLALQQVFGADTPKVPVSSVKSMLGHTMGAASAIESGVCSLAVSTGRIPPTIHFEEADPDCAVDCVPNEGRDVPVKVAMNNAYAFGGNNASVLFREVTS